MDHSLDVIDEALVLNLCRLIYVWFNLNWILVNFCAKLCSNLYLLMSLSNIILENKEHCLVWLKKNAILMNIHIFRWNGMLTYIRCINDAETILGQDSLIKKLAKIEQRRLLIVCWWLWRLILGIWRLNFFLLLILRIIIRGLNVLL